MAGTADGEAGGKREAGGGKPGGVEARRVRLRLFGRVQGVGFRWFVRGEARKLGAGGWVRNERDGSLLFEAQSAEPGVLERLEELARRGPPFARVDRVEREEIASVPGAEREPFETRV